MRRSACFLLAALLCCAAVPALAAKVVPRWDMTDFTLRSDRPYANPFRDIEVFADFTGPDGARRTVRAFYDGGDVWRIRFMPDLEGEWTALTRSEPTDPGLHGKRLELRCGPPKSKGPLRADPDYPRHLIYANGDDFFHLGDTVYNLFGGKVTDAQAVEFIRDAADWRINKFRVLVWNWGVDNDIPLRVVGGIADPDRFDLLYYRRVERLLSEMRRCGIHAGLILRVGLRKAERTKSAVTLSDAQMDVYFRYTIARLAAFDNVYWELDNEYGHPSHHVGSLENLERCAKLVRAEDPYDHPVTSSACCRLPQETQRLPYLEFALFHGKFRDNVKGDHDTMLRMRNNLLKGIVKPIIHDEIAYEQKLEALSFAANGTKPAFIRRQAWANYLAGAYWTYGAAPDRWAGLLNKVHVDPRKDGELARFEYDESAFRWFPHIAAFFEDVPYWRMESHDDFVSPGGNFCLAEEGREYVVQLPTGGAVEVRLGGPGPYDARWYDPRNGEFQSIGTVAAGARAFTAPDQNDWILHLRKQ